MNGISQGGARPPVSRWWRTASIAQLVALALLAAASISMYEQFAAQLQFMRAELQRAPQIQFLAVLLDAQSTPALLVTLDPQDHALQVQRLNAVREGREDSMQLWALAAGQPARSLGVFGSAAQTLRLPVDPAQLNGVRQLALSVENKGGAGPGQGPRLPYLWRGDWLQKAR